MLQFRTWQSNYLVSVSNASIIQLTIDDDEPGFESWNPGCDRLSHRVSASRVPPGEDVHMIGRLGVHYRHKCGWPDVAICDSLKRYW